MGISDKSSFPSFKANLTVDVPALFGLPPEKVVAQPKPQVSVAELAQQKVQAEFAKVATLHGPAQDQARRNFIDSLQVYNAAVGAHQESMIAGLESPFVSTPELIRQSSVIQTSMQRDIILNARDQMHKLAGDAQDLWGTSRQNDRELHSHFEEVTQHLTSALAQFDTGDVDGAFATYRRILSENEAHMGWMARDMLRSEHLKKGAVIGITAIAGAVAMIVTDGIAVAALGPDGVAALSAGARLGLLVGNGAGFTVTQRALEQQILHIPFWRKEGAAANALDLVIDMGRTAALMGTLKVVGEGAAAALPIAKTEPALIGLRNFGAELSGFNGFDIVTGSNPREIFTLHHQLDQLSFLLGLRAANGVITGIPAMMKGAAKVYNRITESPTLARLAYVSLAMMGVVGIPGGKMGSAKVHVNPEELAASHPAVVIIKKNLQTLLSSQNKNELDPIRLQAFINTINDKLPGTFQVYPYDGKLRLLYIEGGQVFFLDTNVATGVKLSISQSFFVANDSTDGPDVLRRRFKRPPGMFLVGFERAYDGAIIPMFSDSAHLTEFRDMSAYNGSGFLGIFADVAGHEAPPRVAMEVPLIPVKTKAVLNRDESAFKSLPHELQGLIESGYTLTTEPSLRGIAGKYYADGPDSALYHYSALIVGDERGQGRTGVLLKDGIPVLVKIDGKECFIEIKGVGLATQAPIENFVHSRREGSIRLGRAYKDEVEREFKWGNLLRTKIFQNGDLSRPFMGVLLPEFVAREQRYLDQDVNDTVLAGQVFRFSSSTRRMAYSKNSAYGPSYNRRPILRQKALEFYGELFARLHLVPPQSASMHDSPHPQNFIYFPVEDRFVITDFSDIDAIERYDYLTPELPNVDQYLAFKDPKSRASLLRGMRKVLEPQGLWTPSLQQLEDGKFSRGKLTATLTSEILVPFVLETNDPSYIRDMVVPRIYDPPFHILEIIKEDPRVKINQGEFLEIAFRHYLRSLRGRLQIIQLVVDSKSLPARFGEFQKQNIKAVDALERLIRRVQGFYSGQGQRGGGGWQKELVVYVRACQKFMEEEAAIYDTITAFRDPEAGSNLETVKQNELADFLAKDDHK